jgi:hypothetical protein
MLFYVLDRPFFYNAKNNGPKPPTTAPKPQKVLQ